MSTFAARRKPLVVLAVILCVAAAFASGHAVRKSLGLELSTEAVVEGHLLAFQVLLEVDIPEPRRSVADLREREVVRRHETDGATFDETADDGLGADASVV